MFLIIVTHFIKLDFMFLLYIIDTVFVVIYNVNEYCVSTSLFKYILIENNNGKSLLKGEIIFEAKF